MVGLNFYLKDHHFEFEIGGAGELGVEEADQV